MATEISDITSKVTLENKFTPEAEKVIASTKKIDDYWQKLADTADKRLDKAFSKVEASMAKHEGATAKLGSSATSAAAGIGALGVAVGAGVIAIEAIGTAMNFAWEQGTKLVKLFPEMAIEGSRISSIASNFDHLTESVGKVGAELVGALREGTHRTVDDLTLMTKVSANLAAGLDLTADQYKIMSTASQALAQATGTNVVTALDKVNRALLTGNAAGLSQLTGRINMIAAEEKFAKALNTTRDHLSEEGRIEAHRLGIIDAMADAQKRLGVQTDGVGDMVDQVSTLWTNFQNKLKQTIAESPAVVAAFTGIRDAITAIFDQNQQKTINAINDSIKSIGVVLIDIAEIAVRVVIIIGQQIAGLLIKINEFRLGVMGAESAWLNFKAGNAENAAKSKEIQDLNKQIGILADSTLQLLNLRDNAPAMSEAVITQLEIIKGKMLNAGKEAGQLYGTGFGGAALGPAVLGGQLNQGVLGGVLSLPGAGGAKKPGDDNSRFLKTPTSETNKIQADTLAGIDKAAAYWDQYFTLVEKGSSDFYQVEQNQIERWYEHEKATLEKSIKTNKDYVNDKIALDVLYDRKRQEALEAEGMRKIKERTDAMAAAIKDSIERPEGAPIQTRPFAIGQMPDIATRASEGEKAITAAMNAAAKSIVPVDAATAELITRMDELGISLDAIGAATGTSFDQLAGVLGRGHILAKNLIADLKQFPQLLVQSFAGGGGVKGALQGLTSMMGADIGGSLGEKASKSIAKGLGGKLGGIIGEVAGTVFPVIGSLIGPLIDKLFSIGGPSKKELEGRDVVAKFEQQFKSSEDMINKVGDAYRANGRSAEEAQAAIQKLWDAEKMGAEATRAALEEITKELEHQKEVTDMIKSMGFTSQEDLDKTAKLMKEAADEMKRSGKYTAEQIEEAYKKAEEAMKRAQHDPTQAMADEAAGAGYQTVEELQKAADKAQKLAEYMRDSGKYTAEAVEDAFKRAQDAADKALGINTEAIKKLKAEYDTLNKQVEGEAAEAEMGVNEKRARDRMAAIEEEMKVEQAKIEAQRKEAVVETAKQTGEATGKAISDALKDAFSNSDRWQTFGPKFNENVDGAAIYTQEQFDAAAKTVQDTFGGIDLHIPVHFDYDNLVMPNGQRAGEAPEPMALGGIGHASGPALFSTQGNEDYAFSGEGKSFSDLVGGGGKKGGPYTIQVVVGGNVVKEVVMDELETAPTSRDVKVFSGMNRAAGRR